MIIALLACAPDPKPNDDSSPAETDSPVDTAPDSDAHDSPAPPANNPPTAAEIAITPAAPAPGLEFSVVILTPSTDPDGDPVTYTYAWTRDGVATDLTGPTVPAESSVLLEVWEVTVTPTDGEDVGPATTASVTVGNSPPIAPVISITPTEPVEGDDLELHFDVEAYDPDGDPLTMTIRWYDNESSMAVVDDLTTVPGRYVDNDEVWLAVVSVTDGYHDPVVAEASVYAAYTCANLPSGALSQDTFADAVAYHGIAFDDDGYLLGWDARSSIFKSEYGGSASLFVPISGTIQQMDRLEDGDWVLADGSAGRLIRLTAAGATSTLASSVGSAYGVVVGPDGDIWVANGGVLRVDKDTGAVTTVVASGTFTAHSLAFNLDSTILYIGTIGTGTIYQLALDSNLDAVGSPTTYATGVGLGYHDGLEIDECGNLYAADYSSRGFYRVETDGTVTAMIPSDMTGYGHGAKWGSGLGGWRDDAIYQPQPYNGNTVREVVIGFHSGDTVRTWNGVAAPL